MRKTWVKCICAILCVIALNVGVWGGVLSMLWYGSVTGEDEFYDSTLCWRVTDENISLIYKKLDLWANKGKDNDLSLYAQEQMEKLDEKLDPAASNFRYRCLEPDGTVLFSNVTGENWRGKVYRVYAPREIDQYVYGDGIVTYTIEYGVMAPLTVEDGYTEAAAQLNWLNAYMPAVAAGSIACIVLGLILLILLMRVAGRRPGRDEVVLNLHDRIPYDLYLAVQIVLNALCWVAVHEGIYYLDHAWDLAGFLWVGGAGLGGSILVIAFLLTSVTRIKARTIFRNTVIWRLCSLLGRGCRRLWRKIKTAAAAIPLIWKAALVCGGYMLLCLIVMGFGALYYFPGRFFVCGLITLALLAYLCWWVLQWKRIRLGTREIIGGNPDFHIDSRKMPPDLKQHADELNNLGQAISAAVDERMKSERFKTELITNVSHDLKTPLTSIINYVDLLKKEEIENSTAREYIEVLDRKSQRLKKLTEDLVEASKASTGALTVTRERLDVVQLIRQALGEYEEKLAGAGLTLVARLPEEPVYIHADGRHVWRVLDNLLGNCAKYAMEGTRVYLDAAAWDGNAVVTVKNVSRNPLNIPAEQLTERFVRGDESRTTEGSGLGLSIARSLVELQGGRFSLDIDGDLFKAAVRLPLSEA